MAYGTVNADVIQSSVSGVSLGAGNATSFKNRIINGAMVIDQRNGGTAITGISTGAYYPVDRFTMYNQSSGTWTAQQVTDAPAGFNNSMKVTVTSAASTGTAGWTSFINTYTEGFNVADIGFGTANCKATTLSFWVKTSIAGTYTYGINNAVDAWLTNTFTVTSANTWQQITIQIPTVSFGTWNTTNGRGLGIFFGLGSGSTYTVSASNSWVNSSQGTQYYASGSTALGTTNGATFQITGVQLEVGSLATGFDYRSYGTELALCQRYMFQPKPVAGISMFPTTSENGSAGGGFQTSITFPVTMRTTPSLTTSGAIDASFRLNWVFAGSTAITSISGTHQGSSVNMTWYGIKTSVFQGAGQMSFCECSSAMTYVIYYSAEL